MTFFYVAMGRLVFLSAAIELVTCLRQEKRSGTNAFFLLPEKKAQPQYGACFYVKLP
jgi:hypothetical protein